MRGCEKLYIGHSQKSVVKKLEDWKALQRLFKYFKTTDWNIRNFYIDG